MLLRARREILVSLLSVLALGIPPAAWAADGAYPGPAEAPAGAPVFDSLRLGAAPFGAGLEEQDPLAADTAECETASGWASRHQARTRLARRDCTHRLASVNHRMRTSHLRRSLQDDGRHFASALHLSAVAPVDESESKLELAGGQGPWSYEIDFDLGREARIDGERFLPEDRSRLQVKSGLDFGLLRSRVQVEGSQREEQRPYARGFAVDPGSTSEVGARVFVDVVLPHLPVLTLGAGRTQREVFRGRRGIGEDVESDVASAALWYGGKHWQAYAVSSRYVFRDDLRPDAPGGLYTDHYVSGSWWPTKTWTLNPSFQYGEASYDGRESWVRTTRASLGLYGTGLWENGLLTLWGGYTRDRDSARTFHYEQLDFAVGIEHTVGEVPMLAGYELAIGGTAGVGQYIDRIYSGASGPGYRASLTLRLSGL